MIILDEAEAEMMLIPELVEETDRGKTSGDLTFVCRLFLRSIAAMSESEKAEIRNTTARKEGQ
jgi:hypothetical protein